MSENQTIQIVGGGFSGLIQAFYLVEAGYPVKVIEKENRLGGLLGSEKKDEFLMEQAANAFIANAELERVAHIIGVELVEKTPAARRRFIFRNGEMRRWPLSFRESLPLVHFFWARKWKNPKFKPKDHESLYDWSLRNLGESLTEYLVEPGIQGVYACGSDQLSARLVLGSLFKKQQKGKLVGSVSPKGGMQEWIDKMQIYLKNQGVVFATGKEWEEFDFATPYIFAVDLKTLKIWCNEKRFPVHKSILETQSASLTAVTLGYKDGKNRLNEGFGCLFPKNENFYALGVLFNHSIFPGRVNQGASETWILNDQNMEFSHMSQTALLRYILSDRTQLAPWVEPDFVKVAQWPERIPLYNEALENFIGEQDSFQSPFLLVGNYLGQLGLSKILFRAQANVEKIEGGFFA